MNSPERAVATIQTQPDQAVDLFTLRGFELVQRIARAFALSDAVPAQFRLNVEKKGKNGSTSTENPAALGNCIVAIETARAVGMSITSVMQQANMIEGKLSWSAQFVIAAINSSRRFTPLQFEFTPRGKVKAAYREKLAWNDAKHGFDFAERQVEIEDVQCYAWAYAIERGAVTTRKIVGPPVSMKMAVEEGWYGKSGSKWQGEMATLMLTYRAGSFFGRIHAPDIVMGMGQTAEEVRDTIDITPQVVVGPADVAAPVADGPPRRVPPIEPREESVRAEPTEPAGRSEVERVEAEPVDDGLPWHDEPPVKPAEEPSRAASPSRNSPPASVGQKQNLRIRARDAGFPLQSVLDTIGAGGVNAETLDGLTEEQFKKAKGVVG